MSKIINKIEPRAFEIIRDVVASIVNDEVSSQFALGVTELAGVGVFLERKTPMQSAEMAMINVTMASTDPFSNYYPVSKDGNYNYHIDVYSRAKTTSEDSGYSLSAFKCHRILGVLDAVFSDDKYATLGLQKPSISRVQVSEILIHDASRDHDAESITMGRLILTVTAQELTEKVLRNIIEGADTQVKLGNTERGYIYSGDNIPIPPPTAPPGDVFNSESTLLGESPSGGSFVVPDSVLTVNGNAFDLLPATVSKDIIVKNDEGGTVGTVIGGEIIVPSAGEIPIGASLQKTNATVSYYTNDDGANQFGRETDFFTLEPGKLNPFGTNEKFTDTVGTQVYLDGIILDWSTFYNGVVLAITNQQNPTGALNLLATFTEVNSSTLNGFSDWFLPNHRQLENFQVIPESRRFGYFPFVGLGASNVRFWTSTPNLSGTTFYTIPNQNAAGANMYNPANGAYHFKCRFYSLADLGL